MHGPLAQLLRTQRFWVALGSLAEATDLHSHQSTTSPRGGDIDKQKLTIIDPHSLLLIAFGYLYALLVTTQNLHTLKNVEPLHHAGHDSAGTCRWWWW